MFADWRTEQLYTYYKHGDKTETNQSEKLRAQQHDPNHLSPFH